MNHLNTKICKYCRSHVKKKKPPKKQASYHSNFTLNWMKGFYLSGVVSSDWLEPCCSRSSLVLLGGRLNLDPSGSASIWRYQDMNILVLVKRTELANILSKLLILELTFIPTKSPSSSCTTGPPSPNQTTYSIKGNLSISGRPLFIFISCKATLYSATTWTLTFHALANQVILPYFIY